MASATEPGAGSSSPPPSSPEAAAPPPLRDLGAYPSSFSDYVRPLMDLLSSLPDNGATVVLVGHSYGGIPISAAMESFPAKISVAVFLTAYMPNCTDPPAALIDEDLELANMLISPSSFFLEEMREKILSKEKYGSVKRCYIICEDDEVMNQEFQKYNVEKSPPHQVISVWLQLGICP